jgi:ElaB/YqjD/DUF883 family membrane-anchored ribosome-binding protein
METAPFFTDGSNPVTDNDVYAPPSGVDVADRSVRTFVVKHPLVTLAAAAAGGFILGRLLSRWKCFEDKRLQMSTTQDQFAENIKSLNDERAALAAAAVAYDAAASAAVHAAASARHVVAALRHHVAEHPYVAIGVSAGLGFVAAGGLRTPVAGGLARFGARLAVTVATQKIGEILSRRDVEKTTRTTEEIV